MSEFYAQVYELMRQIPRGRATSYGRIARMLGRPNGARIVGWALRACPSDLPWQRVVMGDGSIAGGEYAALRRAMLRDEGVPFLPDGRVDMAACRWPDEG